MLTTFGLDEYVFGALRAGAVGFLLKDTPPEELLARGDGGGRRRRVALAVGDPPPGRGVRHDAAAAAHRTGARPR